MQKKKILLSGAGGALFPYLFERLKDKYEVFAVDSNDMIERINPGYKIYTVPLVADNDYERIVSGLIREHSIDFYVPLIDEELTKAPAIAGNCGVRLVMPEPGFVSMCLDKERLMAVLADNGISMVRTFRASSYDFSMEYPVFLKPLCGRGSRGIYTAGNREQYEAYFTVNGYKKQDVIVQEYLRGVEYTVGVVVNSLNQLIAVVPKRIISKRGITQCAVTEKNLEILRACVGIVERFKPCNPFNVQLKVEDAKIRIFEINPRFSTTSILSVEAGVDEFSLAMEYFGVNYDGSMKEFKEGKMLFRRWENIFLEM